MTILFTEQSIQQSLSIARRGYILESGRIGLASSSAELLGTSISTARHMGLEDQARQVEEQAD